MSCWNGTWRRQIVAYAAVQRSDANAVEKLSARASSPSQVTPDIALFDSVAKRPGAREAILLNRQHVIVAALNDAQVGTTDSENPRIRAAFQHATPYAGRERDPAQDRRNFEFVIPVNLPSGRYLYEVEYDHHTYDAQRQEVRTILALIGLLAVIGGGAVFYLVGGRRLMRDHRTVLRRATRDGLTDLPNQRAFHDDFPRAVASAAR